MSIVDSAAAFYGNRKDIRGGEALFAGLLALGVKDFNALAFEWALLRRHPSTSNLANLGRNFRSCNDGPVSIVEEASS